MRKFLLTMLCLLLTSGCLWASEYIMTPDNQTTGNSSTSYVISEFSFKYQVDPNSDEISWAMNQWNPNSLQIKTNVATKSGEFYFLNTSAFPKNVTKVVISFQSLGLLDKFKSGWYLTPSTSKVNLSNVAVESSFEGVWNDTEKTLTFNITGDATYFAVWQNNKVAAGTNKLATTDAIKVIYGAEESTVATPLFSVPEGTFTEPFNLKLSLSNGADVNNYPMFYTLDGTPPNDDCEMYDDDKGINIPAATTTVKVQAYNEDLGKEGFAEVTYTYIDPSLYTTWEKVTSIDTNEESQYIFIGKDSRNNIAGMTTLNGSFFDCENIIQSETVPENLTLSPLSKISPVTINKIIGQDNVYSLKTGDKYIDSKAAKTMILSDDESQWEITFNDQNVPVIKNDIGTFYFNATSPRFTTYTSAQTPIYIYKQKVEQSEPEPVNIEFSIEECVFTEPFNLQLTLSDNKQLEDYILIYTLDGSMPNGRNGETYNSVTGIEIPNKTTTVNVVAYTNDDNHFEVGSGSATYTYLEPANPIFSVETEIFTEPFNLKLSLSDGKQISDYVLIYTLDGSMPNGRNGERYNDNDGIDIPAETTPVNVVVYKLVDGEGYEVGTGSATYTYLEPANPIFSVDAGEFSEPFNLKLSLSDGKQISDYVLMYTLDGSMPNGRNGERYNDNDGIDIPAETTPVNVVVYKLVDGEGYEVGSGDALYTYVKPIELSYALHGNFNGEWESINLVKGSNQAWTASEITVAQSAEFGIKVMDGDEQVNWLAADGDVTISDTQMISLTDNEASRQNIKIAAGIYSFAFKAETAQLAITKIGDVKPVEKDFWLTGGSLTWENRAKFEKQDNGTYTLSRDEFGGEFKIIGSETEWSPAWGLNSAIELDSEYDLSTSEGNIKFATDNVYRNVVFTLTPGEGNALKLKVTAEGTVVVESYYTIACNEIGEWNPIDGLKFEKTADNLFEAKTTEQISNFKVTKVTGAAATWYGVVGDEENVLIEANENITLVVDNKNMTAPQKDENQEFLFSLTVDADGTPQTLCVSYCNAIDEIEIDNQDVQYFNMQGIRINNPEKGGIYIVRRAGKVSKSVK